MKKSTNAIRALTALGSLWNVNAEVLSHIETFVCAMYGIVGDSVDTIRYKLLCSKALHEMKLPPNQDCLVLHVHCVNYQARILKLVLTQITDLPDPSHHGWNIINDELSIKWMSLPTPPPELLKMLKCNCKTTQRKTNQCSCKSANVSCNPDFCGSSGVITLISMLSHLMHM